MNDGTCSFCGKTRSEVRKLISGPRVFVCDACLVGFCEKLAGEHDRGVVPFFRARRRGDSSSAFVDYVALLEQADDGTWSGYIPDLGGIKASASTRSETLGRLKADAAARIQELASSGEPPPASRHRLFRTSAGVFR